jgi:DNA-binding NtrC family response regulator
MSHVLIVGDDEERAKNGEMHDEIEGLRDDLMAAREGLQPSALLAARAPAITIRVGTPLSVAARELILSTLEHCGGERKRTAEMLGICTKTLYNRLREYGFREEPDRPN